MVYIGLFACTCVHQNDSDALYHSVCLDFQVGWLLFLYIISLDEFMFRYCLYHNDSVFEDSCLYNLSISR